MAFNHKITQKFFILNEREKTWSTALCIAILYALFGLCWIFFTDRAVIAIIHDPIIQQKIFLIKGFSFVAISSTVIFLLVQPALKRLGDKDQIIRESHEELKVMVYYDHLTGLQNRRRLIERLPVFLKDGSDSGKAIIYIDMDNVNLINDTMGHDFGDAYIATAAARLSSCLDKTDEMYRVGGDEFLILCHFNRLNEVHDKADILNRSFETPLYVQGSLIHGSVSIGIALYPMHSQDHGELLKCADIAMYRSKKEGKNRAILFNISMMAPIHERMKIGEHLHSALARMEFELYMQPQILVETGKIVSLEALLRWNSPVLGRVPPDKFIPVAEETHLIVQIGDWVLREACRFLKKMHKEGYTRLSVSVNVSMVQLLQQDFPSSVAKILSEYGIDSSFIELEITESVLMGSGEAIAKGLQALNEIGVRIALDDFGKGYSSLAYLEQLPITVLKIDKSFIDGITPESTAKSITGNIVGIGKKLGLEVIAEGVENENQLTYLAEQQCDKIQGWIYSKALPLEEAEQFIRGNLGSPM